MSDFYTPPEFKRFPKMPRFSKETITITEKIDGSNGVIYISEHGGMQAGARNGWVEPEKNKDNQGFAQWVKDNKKELLKLGKGYHYGEWYGDHINRNYGLKEKRFALFNSRWLDNEKRPHCCDVVPVLYKGPFSIDEIDKALLRLKTSGSVLVPGFMNPEGVVVYMDLVGRCHKITFDGDKK